MSQQLNGKILLDDLFWAVLRRWKIITAFSVVVTVLVGVYAGFSYNPQFTSQAQFMATYEGSPFALETVQNLVCGEEMSAAVHADVGQSETVQWTVSSVEGTSALSLEVTASTNLVAFRAAQVILENLNTLGAEAWGSVSVEILEQPTVPEATTTVSDVVKVCILSFILAAVFLSLCFSVVIVLKDNVKSERQARQQLQAPLLAIVPHVADKSKNSRNKQGEILISHPVYGVDLVETYRALALRVIHEMGVMSAKVVLMTGAESGEGTSTAAANLAIALTQEGKNVLLVDLNLRNPSLYKLFRVNKSNTIDLEEMVDSDAEPEEFVVSDRQSGLQAVFNRSALRDVDTLLGSGKIEELIQVWRSRVDCIILDTAAVLEASDAEDIAYISDVSILVVRNNQVSVGKINRVLERLEDIKTPVLGYIYNDVPKHSMVGK
jgi:capsular exopolysaccharide synthesis family protein